MRILSLTTLYPYPSRPAHGVFVENRLRALAAREHDIRVIAPIPYFPSSASLFGDYARYANVPREEYRHGISIRHPRFLVFPKVGMTAAAFSLRACFKRAIQHEIANGFHPDLLDVHYYYPDGVAAAALGEKFNLPTVITARGTDINLIPKFARQKRMILKAADRVDASITVAEALREEMIKLGADGEKITTTGNGVNLDAFQVQDRGACKSKLGVNGPVLLSVGHLIERKGHTLIIEALPSLPDCHLLIVGEGPDRPLLEQKVRSMGVQERVKFLGQVAHDKLSEIYNAADVLILASSREGWPNVLLEAMASGTPCVATPVWGAGEVIRVPEAGRLATDRSPSAIAEATKSILTSPPKREATRAFAEQHDWTQVAQKVETVWTEIVQSKRAKGYGSAFPIASDKQVSILTIDTEECFDWSGNFSTWKPTPVSQLNRLQVIAEKHGYKPLYFVTYPQLTQPDFARRLRELCDAGKADCGLHLHTWSTPPEFGETSKPSSFQSNLSPGVHQQKLSTLIKTFRQQLGFSPIAHRAGRYGIAPWILDQLLNENVRFDFSPSPGFDYSSESGPSFSDMPSHVKMREQNGDVQWVIPVTGGRYWRSTSRLIDPHHFSGGPLKRHLLQKLTVPVRLSPEGNSIETMKTLTRQFMTRSTFILTPSLHLSSLVPGATPYSANETDVDALMEKLDAYLAWSTEIGIQPTHLQGLGSMLI